MVGVTLLRSATGGVVLWPIRSGAASLCARSRGEPSSAHCEQRLSERLTPCPCEPVCACTGMRGHATKGNSGQATQREAKCHPHFSYALPYAAQRAVPGWRGGLGRVGADLASAGSMRPPPSPARHVSTARLATTKARQETAHNTTTARQVTARHHTPTAYHTSKNAAKKVSFLRNLNMDFDHFLIMKKAKKHKNNRQHTSGDQNHYSGGSFLRICYIFHDINWH